MKNGIKNTLFIGGMALSWAAYYAVSKWMVDYTASAFLAGLLLRAAAFVFLTVYLCVKGKFRGLFKVGKLAWILFLIGFLGFLLDTFANLGFRYSSVSTGTVLLKTDILMANVYTAIVLKERLRLSGWLGTMVMLIGVILVLDINYSDFSFNWYDLFFILSALSVTANAFIIKNVQEKSGADSDTVAYYNNFTVMLLFLISALISGDIGMLGSADKSVTFFLLIPLGGLAQSLIYIFYYRNLKVFPVWRVKLFLLFVPVISCFIGVFAFGERLVWMQGIGIFAVLLGAALIIITSGSHRPKYTEE